MELAQLYILVDKLQNFRLKNVLIIHVYEMKRNNFHPQVQILGFIFESGYCDSMGFLSNPLPTLRSGFDRLLRATC